jgi:hypothetical protein
MDFKHVFHFTYSILHPQKPINKKKRTDYISTLFTAVKAKYILS